MEQDWSGLNQEVKLRLLMLVAGIALAFSFALAL